MKPLRLATLKNWVGPGRSFDIARLEVARNQRNRNQNHLQISFIGASFAGADRRGDREVSSGEGRSALQTAARMMRGGVICIGQLHLEHRNLNGPIWTRFRNLLIRFAPSSLILYIVTRYYILHTYLYIYICARELLVCPPFGLSRVISSAASKVISLSTFLGAIFTL